MYCFDSVPATTMAISDIPSVTLARLDACLCNQLLTQNSDRGNLVQDGPRWSEIDSKMVRDGVKLNQNGLSDLVLVREKRQTQRQRQKTKTKTKTKAKIKDQDRDRDNDTDTDKDKRRRRNIGNSILDIKVHLQNTNYPSTKHSGSPLFTSKLHFSSFHVLMYFFNFEVIRTYANPFRRGQKVCPRLPRHDSPRQSFYMVIHIIIIMK